MVFFMRISILGKAAFDSRGNPDAVREVAISERRCMFERRGRSRGASLSASEDAKARRERLTLSEKINKHSSDN